LVGTTGRLNEKETVKIKRTLTSNKKYIKNNSGLKSIHNYKGLL